MTSYEFALVLSEPEQSDDDADALCALSARLLAAGVLPYYVHMPDKVQGSAHFDVSDEDAQALMRALHARLPGYLVPRLVREESGRPGKVLLTPAALHHSAG